MILDNSGGSGGCHLLKGLLGNFKLEDLDDLDKDLKGLSEGLKGLNNSNKLSDASDDSETCINYYDSGIRLRKKTI